MHLTWIYVNHRFCYFLEYSTVQYRWFIKGLTRYITFTLIHKIVDPLSHHINNNKLFLRSFLNRKTFVLRSFLNNHTVHVFNLYIAIWWIMHELSLGLSLLMRSKVTLMTRCTHGEDRNGRQTGKFVFFFPSPPVKSVKVRSYRLFT